MQPGSSALTEGQLIGGCRIVRLLGRGGMGEVYLAEHLSLERPVALKTLRPDLEKTDLVERFLKEARMCARIQHPNVVVIHDVGEQQGLYYIVMQFVQGRNLAQLAWEYEGLIPWRSALRIVQLAASGLQAVHDEKLVHRDVKPSNIMLARDSRVLLMDFGLVGEEVGSSVGPRTRPMGTPPFMSPEQCRCEPLDRRSDVFSLGSSLYFMFSGVEPYEGSSQEVMARIGAGERPRPIQELNREIPPEVQRLLDRAMAPAAGQRFSTASEMAREAKKLLKAALWAPTPLFNPPGAQAPNAKETARRNVTVPELLPLRTPWEAVRAKWPWVAVAALACVALLGIALALAGREEVASVPESSATVGMVYVQPGAARLGNDPKKVRQFLASYMSGSQLDKAMEAIGQETQQRVEVAGFFIDQYEVTNAEYARFLAETGRAPPKHYEGNQPPSGKEDHPVVNITYDDAEAYARWAGKRLPTREQWMRAFRGDHDWLFPWGDDYEPSRTNVGDNSRFPSTSPIRDTPEDASPFDVRNMVGNASEFIRGTFAHKGGTWRVSKGAEYKLPGFIFGIGSCQYLYRPLDLSERGLGFRCVREEP